MILNITDCLTPHEISSSSEFSACYNYFFFTNPAKAILEIVNFIHLIFLLLIFLISKIKT